MSAFSTKKRIARKSGGFIALITSVIISVILLLLVVNLSFTSFISRGNILDGELKEKSYALAEACVDVALLELAKNPDYVGGQTETIDTETCTIDTTGASDPRIFTIHASPDGYTTDLQIDVDVDTVTINKWQEI
jgi:hypothetical protein